MNAQDHLRDEDSVEVIEFPALSHCSFKVGKGDLLGGNEERVGCLEELYNLDGVLYLGVLEFFEIPGDLRRRREQ